MANVIKHKRGSGSDPVASDLVVGEVAIRTDVGKLFTKMDNGSVAEIAGGGSDIAINTLSSSSATGGGSATFNGSAYRFTLSAPPSVSAQQLLVSINGVIQKPVAGTGQPSEGFSVDGTDIILGDAPATGSDFFILTFKSLGVSEPADNSVTSAKIVDGTIVNADINASAAIAGSKISTNFGAQLIQTTGSIVGNGIQSTNNLSLDSDVPTINFNDSNSENDFELKNNNGTFTLRDKDAASDRLTVTSAGQFTFTTNVDFSSGIDVTGAITATGNITAGNNSSIFAENNLRFKSTGGAFIDHNTVGQDITFRVSGSSSNDTNAIIVKSTGNVGIGTINPGQKLHIHSGSSSGALNIQSNGSNNFIAAVQSAHNFITGAAAGSLAIRSSDGIYFSANDGSGVHMTMLTSGNVGIGTTDPSRRLNLNIGGDQTWFQIDKSRAANEAMLQLVHTAGNRPAAIRYANSQGSWKTGIDGTEAFVIASGATDVGDGTPRMTIDSSGNTKFNSGFGSATTVYGCRAWVKLNQTGTQSISGSGGVSSITDLGLGHTQVNFATTMPDVHYAMVGGAQQSSNPSVNFCFSLCMQARNTGNANFLYRPNATTDTKQDNSQVDVAFFR